jgi:hypothetical protein
MATKSIKVRSGRMVRETGEETFHRLGIRMPESIFKKIEDEHWKRRVSMNVVILEVLEKAFGK